ncbi:MAG: hypothetical protein MI919_11005 [Holophagales bacterium]|nr:hypothetical protein [Holophagales bacterium]
MKEQTKLEPDDTVDLGAIWLPCPDPGCASNTGDRLTDMLREKKWVYSEVVPLGFTEYRFQCQSCGKEQRVGVWHKGWTPRFEGTPPALDSKNGNGR